MTASHRTRLMLRIVAAATFLFGLSACQDDVTGPGETDSGGEIRPDPRDSAGVSAGTISRSRLSFEGDVNEVGSSVAVRGAVHMNTEYGRASFLGADMSMTFDDTGRLRSVSGRARIPSPHDRIEFADPVEADIGFFSGRDLNRTGLVGIRLKDDTDYFVYRVATTFQMRIATGDTGPDAVKPISIRAPLGGEIVMVVDYTDPMYYVFGAQDLIGAAGMGWSHNHRIPFVPDHPVQNLGTFDGGTTRTGTIPVFKILSVSGQMVENEDTEVHLSLEDPFSPSLRMDYQVGFNGEMALDLFLKDIVGLEIPLADASGGMWRELSTRDVFRGHAYVNGLTRSDFSWWPSFLAVKPASRLATRGAIESSGNFEVTLEGEYGWDLPSGRSSMSGSFALSPEAMTIEGTITSASEPLTVRGNVTGDATSLAVVPPQSLLSSIHSLVVNEVDSRVAEAEQAWNDLQEATSDYQIELSLRGLRSSLPKVAQTARGALTNRINSELSKHSGKVYYNSLKSHLKSAADPYYDALDRLEAAAKEIRDNDQTRREIEQALRGLAARRTFSTTYTYKVLGVTAATVKVSATVLSTSDANRLITAANNVKYIKETSDRKIRMQQIYDAIPSREIFAQIKEDIENGVSRIPTLEEFGFVIRHSGSPAFSVYAILGGERHEFGSVDPFDPAAVGDAVSAQIVTNFGG
jgi:hypothetical protein